MNFTLVLIIAISLSMDAFSLSLAYGTLPLEKKEIYTLSSIVGIYHFIMPLLGFFLGKQLLKIFPIDSNLIVFIVLCFIGIEMIIDTFRRKENVKKMKLLEMLTFGLAVSLDALSVGVSLKLICEHYIITSIIFSITSYIFTYGGLILGNKINKLIGNISTFFGGLVLVIVGISYIF